MDPIIQNIYPSGGRAQQPKDKEMKCIYSSVQHNIKVEFAEIKCFGEIFEWFVSEIMRRSLFSIRPRWELSCNNW